ncbi:hypothetical protein ACHAWO_013710 [Cyclotella atomus]|uniref:LAGLIDADG homing endonuclease n=1 Tax=Cyclotella atomus TaxID=382360 RepID=A0ABD3PGA6_9STRA
MKSKTINATKSTGSSSNNIEVDVDTTRSILVHPNLKTAEIDDVFLQTLNCMGCRLDSLMLSRFTIKNIYFIDYNLKLTFTIKWAVSLEDDPLYTYRFRSKGDYEKFCNMIGLDVKDIPDGG